MCLIVFGWKTHPDYPLVLAANRDEYLQRPASPLHFWDDAPATAGGRDVEKGGSWLAVNRDGRWAAVTNFRDGRPATTSALSRGHLVRDFMVCASSASEYATRIAPAIATYPGCNLLLGDSETVLCISNRHPASPHVRIETVTEGVHGLSNHFLDTPWPKVERAKQAVQDLLGGESQDLTQRLLAIMADRTVAQDDELPSTGVSHDQERVLSAPFIVAEGYGTRASTVVLMDSQGQLYMHERGFGAGGVEISRRELMV